MQEGGSVLPHLDLWSSPQDGVHNVCYLICPAWGGCHRAPPSKHMQMFSNMCKSRKECDEAHEPLFQL